MSDTTYNYIETTGVIVGDTEGILTTVTSEYQAVFGDTLNADGSTPQGKLINAETVARASVVQNNAVVANQINPNQSMGVFLDAVCELSGLDRIAATSTKVSGGLTGVQSSLIPAGSIAKTTAGDQFSLDDDVTLDAVTGNAIGFFTSIVSGPIPCGAGSAGLTEVTAVLGWEGISSPAAFQIGTLEQGDEVLRALRRKTLALQGVGLMEAVLSAINVIPGVIGSQGRENYTGADATIDGIFLVKNSVWVCVDGGDPAAIGTALLQNKSMGSNWNGAQTITLIEPASGQSYTVLWDIPTPELLVVQVTARQGTFVGDPTTSIKQAVVDFANNNTQPLTGFVVGESASPFDIGAAVLQECPGLHLVSVKISLASSVNLQPVEIAMALNQKATTTADNVAVVLVA